MDTIKETQKLYEQMGMKVSIPYVVFGLLVYLVVSIGMVLYMPIHAYILAWRGKASKYTGLKISIKEHIWLNQSGQPYMLKTDQGDLAFVHGLPDGSYNIGYKITKNIAEVFCVFPRGEFTIVSCYNGAHKDIDYCGRKFTRDRKTLTQYPSTVILFPWGTMIVFSDKWSERCENLKEGKVSF